MKLTKALNDNYEYKENVFLIDASFDNILKVIKLMNDEKIHVNIRPILGLNLLIKKINNEPVKGVTPKELSEKLLSLLEPKDMAELFVGICEKYIEFEEPERDLQGNIMPMSEEKLMDRRLIDYEQDAEYIYASFMYAYGIDLIDVQGKLHWKKFQALMTGLPSDAKISEVISIRSWKPSNEKKKYKTQMLELKEHYKLKG